MRDAGLTPMEQDMIRRTLAGRPPRMADPGRVGGGRRRAKGASSTRAGAREAEGRCATRPALMALLVAFIRLNTGLHVTKLFCSYLEEKRYLFSFGALCAAIPILTLGFFLEHQGVDPSFEFAWLGDEGNSNATALGTLP